MSDHYQLDKVIILSRHGIRTPLFNTIEFLNQVSPLKWPKWNYPDGYLTTRGGTLEAYFGNYFSAWLKKENLILSDLNNELFVYANSVQRTVATAQFFITGAFAGYDVPIHHKYAIEKMDPIFDPILRSDSTEFKQSILNSLDEVTIDENLTTAYELLSDILEYSHSPLYQKYQCELKSIPTTIHLNKNREPSVIGPLAIGTAVADAFLLQYYSDFSQNDVAWGKINSDEQWRQIVAIRNHFINLLYVSKPLAKHITAPLANFVNDLIHHNTYKVSLLVGHDSNIAAFLGALDFKNYTLTEQFEHTPIGGKVVLQRFYHQKSHDYFFKANYIYPSFEQLRSGRPLDFNNPPKCITLQLENAELNQDGFYKWSDFIIRLQENLF